MEKNKHQHHDSHDDHSNHDDHDHHDHSNHDHHDGHHHHGDFKQIFMNSLVLGIPILLMAPFFGLTETGLIHFAYSDIVVAILATILLIYGGKPFFQGGWQEAKNKAPGMMALVSLGLGVSYLYSMYAVIANYVSGQHLMDFFFEFASLVLIMLLGHWIEMEALGDAGDAQQSLAALLPKEVHVLADDDTTVTKALSALKIGDLVRVQAGENIPADGVIVRGDSRVNESLLTGEAVPIEKHKGDQVIGGSTNGPGVLYVEIQEVGEKSFISQVQHLVSQAQSHPSRAEDLANRVASWLFWIALGAALLAFIIWFNLEGLESAVSFAVATLIIACPHALGLAIPLVVSRSTSLGAQRGLLVKNREVYELTSKATHIVLDKTGTLTTGEFKVLDTQVFGTDYTEEEFIALLAGLEAGSSHPIAQSIITHAEAASIQASHFEQVEVLAGKGVSGQLNGKDYQLLSQKAYGQPLDVQVPTGATLSILTENGQAIGTVALGDELKATSKALIDFLKAQGIQPMIATGDNESAAKAVADLLEVDYRASMSPQDKYALIESYKNAGQTVIMVGDGVNDAPSLALADVGVAVGAGTQVALDSADVILTQSDPGDIEAFVELSINTDRKMKQNLAWGAGYNFLAIPIAAGILAPIGLTLAPAVGAILMSASTVIVAFNAMTLNLSESE
ncbi:copper-translocating P-type ATPase [Fundicoccus ignavus]|uniref:P-type Cu(+) transporter n=1 Tax=Fundicoccus ignavus TaxID=2664442 RepID=A0A844BYW6_9LACT|nr:copper-translocating P-type ATPase [Fundicoccus ignavus]MRJ47248.1 cadmium-translocating P-type ATPase [Fundicoccus ignavus]